MIEFIGKNETTEKFRYYKNSFLTILYSKESRVKIFLYILQ